MCNASCASLLLYALLCAAAAAAAPPPRPHARPRARALTPASIFVLARACVVGGLVRTRRARWWAVMCRTYRTLPRAAP